MKTFLRMTIASPFYPIVLIKKCLTRCCTYIGYNFAVLWCYIPSPNTFSPWLWFSWQWRTISEEVQDKEPIHFPCLNFLWESCCSRQKYQVGYVIFGTMTLNIPLLAPKEQPFHSTLLSIVPFRMCQFRYHHVHRCLSFSL